MCIGIPMQVREVAPGHALCQYYDGTRWVDMRLIDPPVPGDWLLVFLDAAREPISAERAARVGDALEALKAVRAGDLSDLDRLFADFANREPRLPPHLQAQLPVTEDSP